MVKNMTDWRLAVSMTGGGGFASALLFVTVCVSYARHRQWSYSSYYM